MKKKVIIGIVAGAVLVNVVAISVFGAYINSSKAASSEVKTHNAVYEEVDAAAGDNRYYATSSGVKSLSATSGAPKEDTAFDAEANAVEPQAQGTGVSSQVNVDPEKGRLLIRTVTITAETKDYQTVASSVESQVKAAGGYIEHSSMQGTGNNHDLRTGTYVVRVPADKLDGLISTVGSSATITSANENTSDVTLEYVDTKSRVESLRVEYEQLMKILSETTDLNNIVVLQKRLTEVRYQIESAESRIRVLENQVQYATLTLTLREVLEEKEIEEPHVITFGERVKEQFKDMWEGTVEFGENFVLGMIALIPFFVFLIVVAGITLIIVFSVRKKRRKRIAKALAAKEAAEASKEEKKEEEKADKE